MGIPTELPFMLDDDTAVVGDDHVLRESIRENLADHVQLVQIETGHKNPSTANLTPMNTKFRRLVAFKI